MSDDPERGESNEALHARIMELETALDVATRSAAAAEAEQGRLRGELTKVTELWSAACHARERWDVLLSENVEDLRLARERAEVAERRRREIEESTSWRLLQRGLGPYRRLRGIR